MKILALAIELPDATPEQFMPHLPAESRRVWEMYLAGSLREIYFRQELHSAVLMLECADTAEAQALLDTLPLVKAGVIRFDLLPLVPYDGYEILFTDV